MSLVAEAGWVVDVGPQAGVNGGHIIYSGSTSGLDDIAESVTVHYLNPAPLVLNQVPARSATGMLPLTGITSRTIIDQNLEIPLGQLTDVTGDSGSGESTFISPVLACFI